MSEAVDYQAFIYPPTSADTRSSNRVRHSAMRWRMLQGLWKCDLMDALLATFGTIRAALANIPDMSSNVARDVWTQSSALFKDTPAIQQADADAQKYMTDALTRSHFASFMDGFQPVVVAQREAALGFEVQKQRDGQSVIKFEVIPAHLCDGIASKDNPLKPVVFWEFAPKSKDNVFYWTKRKWDITNPKAPKYTEEKVSDHEGKSIDPVEITPKALSEWPDEWRYSDDTPFIPRVLFHADLTSPALFNPYYGIELVEGTTSIAVKLTFAGHCYNDASWPQREVADGQPVGARVDPNQPGIAQTINDPSVIGRWKSDGGNSIKFFQWNAGSKPSELLAYISDYTAPLLSAYGVSPTDAQRMAADPRSGYAIALTNDGIRKQSERYAPPFTVGVSELLEKLAAMLTRLQFADLPDTGWSCVFRGVPLSPAEQKALADTLKARADLGVASRVDIYMAVYGERSREIAKREVRRIIAEEKELNSDVSNAPESPAATAVKPPMEEPANADG